MFEGLKVSATWLDQEDWFGVRADKWRVTITRNGQRMQIPFSQGSGFEGKPPTVETVIECLVSDAHVGLNDFDDFCSDLGYEEDSREAYKTWKACKSIGERLPKILTPEEFEAVAEGAMTTMEQLSAIKTKNN